MNAILELYKKAADNPVEELIRRVCNYAWEEMTLEQQGELREEAAIHYAALTAELARLQRVEQERDEYKSLIREMNEWIVNWEADFTYDDEWKKVEKRIAAALKGETK